MTLLIFVYILYSCFCCYQVSANFEDEQTICRFVWETTAESITLAATPSKISTDIEKINNTVHNHLDSLDIQSTISTLNDWRVTLMQQFISASTFDLGVQIIGMVDRTIQTYQSISINITVMAEVDQKTFATFVTTLSNHNSFPKNRTLGVIRGYFIDGPTSKAFNGAVANIEEDVNHCKQSSKANTLISSIKGVFNKSSSNTTVPLLSPPKESPKESADINVTVLSPNCPNWIIYVALGVAVFAAIGFVIMICTRRSHPYIVPSNSVLYYSNPRCFWCC